MSTIFQLYSTSREYNIEQTDKNLCLHGAYILLGKSYTDNVSLLLTLYIETSGQL